MADIRPWPGPRRSRKYMGRGFSNSSKVSKPSLHHYYSSPRDPNERYSRRSEFLFERTHFEFHRPSARILVCQMPVGLCDRLGLEKVAVVQGRLQSTRTRDVDTAVDVDPRDVDASRTQVSRE